MGFIFIKNWLIIFAAFGLTTLPIIALGQSDDLYEIPFPRPTTFEEVEDIVDPRSGEIIEKLREAQCGGWDFAESVVGKITQVQGLPGRDSDLLGAIDSGMALRLDDSGGYFNDGYTFPNQAEVVGYSTVCTGLLSLDEPDCSDPEQCRLKCAQLNRNQYTVTVCKSTITDNPATTYIEGVAVFPEVPTGECRFNNDPRVQVDLGALGGEFVGVRCFREWRYCCTDAAVTKRDYELCQAEPVDGPFRLGDPSPTQCALHPDRLRNCVRCEGDGIPDPDDDTIDVNGDPLNVGLRNETGCRWGGVASQGVAPFTVDRIQPVPVARDVDGRGTLPNRPIDKQYLSFYRNYGVVYSRDPVGPETRRMTQNVGFSACFGAYQEFDPKTAFTGDAQRKCVLQLPTDWFGLRQGDLIGSFGDDTPPRTFPFTPRRDFDEESSTWDTRLSDSFSLLNSETFEGDFTQALLDVDETQLEASVQISDDLPLSSGALVRAFGDAVTIDEDGVANRPFERWWQSQQTEMQQYLTPPTVRIWLPDSQSLLGSDIFQRLLAEDTDGEAEPLDPLEAVEIQLNAREDLLGEVAALLQSSQFMRVKEAPVVVAVPSIARAELLAIEHQWCREYMRQNDEDTCERASGEIGDFIQRLQEYRAQIDNVRAMRAELASYAGELLALQQDWLEALSNWFEDINSDYQDLLVEIENTEDVAVVWEAVNDLYRFVSEETGMPMCMNTRFTPALYSWLDGWLPSRQGRLRRFPPALPGTISSIGLPTLTVEQRPDVVLDFSLLNVGSFELLLPVLKPVQIRIDAASLSVDVNGGTPPELQALPLVPELTEGLLPSSTLDVENRFPSLSSLIRPLDEVVTFEDATDIDDYLEQIDAVLLALDDATSAFWDSLKIDDGRSTVPLRCREYNADFCVHTEMDLRERWQRATARYGLLLEEDFESIGLRRSADINQKDDDDTSFACDSSDWACLSLPPQRDLPRQGWQTTVLDTVADRLREAIETERRIWLEQPFTSREWRELPIKNTLLDLVPIYDVPEAYDFSDIVTPPRF